MNPKTITLDFSPALTLLRHLYVEQSFPYEIDFAKNKFKFLAENDSAVARFLYPLPLTLSGLSDKDQSLIEFYSKNLPSFYILLIQAGHAAIGFCANGKLQKHKVIRKYMVRQKQGKAQLNYLKTKGKSRAGSRIRLANTKEFFEEINERLNLWQNEQPCNTCLYSCSPTLWGMLFKARPAPPFQRKSAYIKKIPFDIPVPKLDSLVNLSEMVLRGRIEFQENCPAYILEYFKSKLDLIISQSPTV